MLIVCMLTANLLAAFLSLYDAVQANGDCYDIVPGNDPLNVVLFIVFRIITHYALMAIALYVFWARRRPIKHGYSAVSFR